MKQIALFAMTPDELRLKLGHLVDIRRQIQATKEAAKQTASEYRETLKDLEAQEKAILAEVDCGPEAHHQVVVELARRGH